MDFKALLDLEIEKKKKQLAEAKEAGVKFVRRADLEKEKSERQKLKETDQLEEKRRRVEEVKDDSSEQVEVNVTVFSAEANESIERRLKLKGHPIRLFGETDELRAARLKVLESKELLESDKIGQKNEYMQTISEIQKKDQEKLESGESVKLVKEDDLTAMHIEQVDLTLLKQEADKARTIIYGFFKRLLKEWGHYLENLPEEEKKSSQGRMNLVLQKQSKENLQPFFKMLKKDQLQKDVLENITKMCHHMQKREYVKANDVYLRLAIGNAPWPIGVTSVGIHERSARERISSSQTAHVLNDEATRKWLQAIKRLITFCQTKYPPALRAQLMG